MHHAAQKTVLRLQGAFLILGGIFAVVVSGKIEEESKPREIRYGYSINGNTTMYDTGYIGGNPKGEEASALAKGLGIMCMVLGRGMVILSIKIGKDQECVY